MVKKIKFLSIDAVKEFVAITGGCPYDVDLISGRYVIDAKSIMGIFSLDLDVPMEIHVHSENAGEYLEKISKFLVD